MKNKKENLELERKFLISKDFRKQLKGSKRGNVYLIEQFYTDIKPNFETRMRNKLDLETGVNEYSYTEKEGTGDTRIEDERKIPQKEYEETRMKLLNKGLFPIIKKRMVFVIEGYTVEVDLYLNFEINDLLVCEVEFKNNKEMQNFKTFDFMVREVTNDRSYKNVSLYKKINNIN